MKTQVNLKIDVHVKEKAQKRAAELGLSLSSVVNATLSQFARTGELNLSSAPAMTPFLETVVKEARADYEAGNLKVYENADDFIASLNK
jgi:addiction module RelB/DinJ family antitoxin